MSAPPDRDQQIKLMQEAEARMAGRARAWMSNPTIKAVFAKPAPGQENREQVTHEMRRIKKCG